MASLGTVKTKRKGFEEVYDDFSSLSLSVPAAKIRRLDADLLQSMEMPDRVGCQVFEHQPLEGFTYNAVADAPQMDMMPIVPPTENHERALILYKPIHPHFTPSLQMDPSLLTCLKNSALWSSNQNLLDEDLVEEQHPASCNNSLAVIPWVSSVHAPSLQVSTSINGTVEEDSMDAVESSESMEIEGECAKFIDSGAGGFHQWQQHCMTPELSRISSAPVLGSW